jgi:lipoprotein-releasing system permease protein
MPKNPVWYIADKLSSASDSSRTYRISSRIAVVSVALGVIALSVSLAILEGFDRKLYQATSLFSGDIKIASFSGQDKLGKLSEKLNIISDSLDKTDSYEPTATVSGGIMMRSGDNLDGYVLIGMDTADIKRLRPFLIDKHNKQTDPVNDLITPITEGQLPKVLLPEKLLSANNISVYDTVTIFTVTSQPNSNPFAISYLPPITTRPALVAGSFRSGMGKFDEGIIITSLPIGRKFLGFTDEEYSSIILRKKKQINDVQDQALVEAINEKLGYPHWANTAKSLHYQEFLWIEIQKKPIPIVLSLISIIAAFTIMTTILIGTVEKTKQIGLLRMLGLADASLYKMVIYQSLLFCIKGIVIGLLVSGLFLTLQYFFEPIRLDPDIYFVDSLPVAFVWWHYATIVALAILLSILASFLPIRYTLKATPLKAIDFR